jgi:hypothetical protein
MRESGRVALAKWAWKAKQYVVQVRPAEDGLVLQQLLYADEVRSMKELDIEKVTVSPAELKLAMQLIEQISEDTYDPTMFEDEEKKRILAAIDEKIAGKQIVANEPHEPASGGAQVIDLVEALRASLGKGGGLKGKAAAPASTAPVKAAEPAAAQAAPSKERKGVKRAAKVEEAPPRAHAGQEVTSQADPSPYTIRAIQEMLGLSRGVITGLIASGFVAPSRGPRNEYRFTFREVVLLRTAVELQAARIPPRKILASLRKLKATLPAELPLTGLRITAVGNDVTVRDGRSQWHADTGQLVMDFELAPPPATSPSCSERRRGRRRRPPMRRPGSAAARRSRRATGAPPKRRTGASSRSTRGTPTRTSTSARCCARAAASTRRSRSTTKRSRGSRTKRCFISIAPSRSRTGRRGRRARQLPRLPAPVARPRRRALQRRPPAPAARRRAPGGAPLQRLPAPAAAALTAAAVDASMAPLRGLRFANPPRRHRAGPSCWRRHRRRPARRAGRGPYDRFIPRGFSEIASARSDFDGDGRPDLVIVLADETPDGEQATCPVIVLLARPSGGWRVSARAKIDCTTGRGPHGSGFDKLTARRDTFLVRVYNDLDGAEARYQLRGGRWWLIGARQTSVDDGGGAGPRATARSLMARCAGLASPYPRASFPRRRRPPPCPSSSSPCRSARSRSPTGSSSRRCASTRRAKARRATGTSSISATSPCRARAS